MRNPIFWVVWAVVGCAPDRVADDPVTRAGIAAALTPPPRGALHVQPGLPPGVTRTTVVQAILQHDEAPVATLRELRTAARDAAGNERLDVWTLADTAAVVEDGRTCILADGALYSGWRTRPPQRLRPQTRPERCITIDPLAELVARFADELAVAGRAFRLRDRERPPPDPIPLTWPEGVERQTLGEPRALYLVANARPLRLRGQLERDPAGHLLGGHLTARFAVRKDGRDATLDLVIRAWHRRGPEPIEAPAEHTVEIPRPRIVPQIEAVLGTLPADPTPLPGPGDAPPLKLPGEPHDRPVGPGSTSP